MIFKGSRGTYSLGNEIKKGGEGTVYTVSGANKDKIVAKIYHQDKLTAELEKKIIYMANNPPSDSVLDQIAWPKDVLYNSSGNFAGFIMPKLDIDTDLKKIYPYPPQKNVAITIKHKLIIAINICIVISEVHKAGYIFGDFNPCNIGVNLTTGHVAFFDADSYHFTDTRTGKTYRCGVGFDGYVAPELIHKVHGSSYLSAPLPTFTKETDEFALAIHIFKLLMNGYTPFNGIKETDSVSQASPGTGNLAIERNNYCFKRGNKPQSLATPRLDSLPNEIQVLLKRTFIDGVSNPGKRASADEWRVALDEYYHNLTNCRKNPTHMYYKTNDHCPFCEADSNYQQSLMKTTKTYGTGSSGLSTSQYNFATPISVPNTPQRGVQLHLVANNNQPNITYRVPNTVGNQAYSSSIYNRTYAPGYQKRFNNTTVNLANQNPAAFVAQNTPNHPALWKKALPILLAIPIGLFNFVVVSNMLFPYSELTLTIDEFLFSNKKIQKDTKSAPSEKKILNLKYTGFEDMNIIEDIPEDFRSYKDWNNSVIFGAGSGEDYAYKSVHLNGDYSKLSLSMEPYNYNSSFSDDTCVELEIIDLDTGNIIKKAPLDSASLPVSVDADVSGIEDLCLMVTKTAGDGLGYSVLSDIYLYPDNTNTSDDSSKKTNTIYGKDELNLSERPTYDSQNIEYEVPMNFTYDDHICKNAMIFKSGSENAYGIWEINSEYSNLSFEMIPFYYKDYFAENSYAEIQVTNVETGQELYNGAVNYSSGKLDITADISGVNFLRIDVNGKPDSYCLLNQCYVYNGRIEETESKNTDEELTSDYILPNSSTELILDSILESLDAEKLKLARNEIYARHGRKFDDNAIQSYFDSKSWYKGFIEPDVFDESVLSNIELYNLGAIERQEKRLA